jgi:hypothetical protein
MVLGYFLLVIGVGPATAIILEGAEPLLGVEALEVFFNAACPDISMV